mmetsp:Transcript_59190/g.135779  ORF Transcript_59190/g.135779 Transcript_59190/m.135779 type:complete len:176 (-) Transcript_59190:580-1107(-)
MAVAGEQAQLACMRIQAAYKRMVLEPSEHAQSESAQDEAELECAICYEIAPELVEFPVQCGHRFCAECTQRWCMRNACISCPMCRAASTPPETYSDKLEALRARLEAFREAQAAERREREAAKRPARTRAGRMKRRVWQRMDAAMDALIAVGMYLEELEKLESSCDEGWAAYYQR